MKTDLDQQLLGLRRSFEDALPTIGTVRGQLIADFLNALDSSSLENSERESRLAAIYARADLGITDYVQIIEAGLRLRNIILRNALAQLLPPQFKSKIFPATQPTTVPGAATASVIAELQIVQASTVPGEAIAQENFEPHSDVLIFVDHRRASDEQSDYLAWIGASPLSIDKGYGFGIVDEPRNMCCARIVLLFGAHERN